MQTKAWNWRLWVGFVLVLVAPFCYFSLFETTRAALWISVALIVLAIVLLVGGLRRAFTASESYRGKIAGPILATLALVVVGVFGWATYAMHSAYAEAHNAPRVGDKAPEFALMDGSGRKVTMAELLAAPLPTGPSKTRGVMLVFYRGYW
ncbi:MAG TPA: hypothetical protein VH196_09925 [Terriglobales bacterium]|nr:hypothetical protein [Terriglobales bacterium]